jgi:hypothetical protein
MATPTPPAPRTDPGNSRSFARSLGEATAERTQTRPYLGAYDVVEGLVRALLSEEMDRAVQLSERKLTAAAYQQQSVAAVKRMAKVFTGQDPGYTVVKGWHTAPLMPGSATLTSTIAARLALQVAPQHLRDPYQASTALFSLALLEYRQAIKRWAQDNNAQAMQQAGEDLTENYTRLLMGLPADDDQ